MCYLSHAVMDCLMSLLLTSSDQHEVKNRSSFWIIHVFSIYRQQQIIHLEAEIKVQANNYVFFVLIVVPIVKIALTIIKRVKMKIKLWLVVQWNIALVFFWWILMDYALL